MKLKNYMMTIEEKVDSIPGIMEKTAEAECLVEVIDYALKELKLETAYAQEIAKDYIAQMFNEYWSLV